MSSGCPVSETRPPVAVATHLVRLALAVTGLLAFVALAGCGTSDEGSSSQVYTDADRGRTVTAAVGDTISIWLSENPSTGFSWAATSSDGLQQLESRFDAPSSSPELVGAPGTRVLTYEVTASGRQSIRATYERAWEAGAAEPFTLMIEVD
jgi:predicted secreted protein